MIDEKRANDSDPRPGSRLVLLGSLARYVPGTAPGAPKRNALVVLVYVFVSLLAVGLLWTAL